MDDRESRLDVIHEEDSFEDVEDVEMVDVEEGEVVEAQDLLTESGQTSEGNVNEVNMVAGSKRRKRKNNKKKNKKRKGTVAGSNVTDINRFVLDVCKRLREKKTYLVYTAVGVLGLAALSDLVKEVEAILFCGGQMTADGRRNRTGGGILWNILKARDSNAYKEIMKKGKEFEKQFKLPNIRQPPDQKNNASQDIASAAANPAKDGSEIELPQEDQLDPPSGGVKRTSVHDRIRVPVSYDDLLVGDEPDDQSS